MPSDLVFYAAGAILGAIALFTLYRSLLHDRFKNRKRRRCPKCWYDMSGSPGLTCSECGYMARKERKLHKIRRRWRWAMVGLIPAVLATSSALVPHVRQHGYESIVPTTALVLIAPYIENKPMTSASGPPRWVMNSSNVRSALIMPAKPSMAGRLMTELQRRINADQLRDWQWRLLVSRVHRPNAPLWSFAVGVRSDWSEGVEPRALPFITFCPASSRWIDRLLRFKIVGSNESNIATLIAHSSIANANLGDWLEPTFVCDKAKHDAQHLPCKIVVYRALKESKKDSWQQISSRNLNVPILRQTQNKLFPDTGVGSSAAPDVRMRIYANAECLGVTWSRLAPGADLPTIALRFTLRRDGKSMGSAHAWWGTEQPNERSAAALMAVPHHYRIRWDDPPQSAAFATPDRAEWTLRIEADPDLALRDINSTRYWSGTMLVPLHWNAELQQLDGNAKFGVSDP